MRIFFFVCVLDLKGSLNELSGSVVVLRGVYEGWTAVRLNVYLFRINIDGD